MKKVNGFINIELNVDCPYCDEMLDLAQVEDTEPQKELILALLLSHKDAGKNLNIEQECPACGEIFLVESVS